MGGVEPASTNFTRQESSEAEVEVEASKIGLRQKAGLETYSAGVYHARTCE